MDSDVDIARRAKLKPVMEIGEKLGIPADALIPYGHTKAKISAAFLKSLSRQTGWRSGAGDRDEPDAGG